jgi:hypothetical protein
VSAALGGGTEFYFPAARNPGMASGLTVFFVSWSAIILAIGLYGGPWFFFFLLVDALVAYSVLSAWFKVTRVVAERGCIAVRSGLFGFGATKAIQGDDIQEIKVAIRSRTGLLAYHDINIVRKSGYVVSAGGSIRDKREATWLAWQMTRCVRGERAA